MLSQHFCQLLAAAAFPNCDATLDKASAASFDHEWGEYETTQTSDLFWFVSTCCSLKPPRNSNASNLIVNVRLNWGWGG